MEDSPEQVPDQGPEQEPSRRPRQGPPARDALLPLPLAVAVVAAAILGFGALGVARYRALRAEDEARLAPPPPRNARGAAGGAASLTAPSPAAGRIRVPQFLPPEEVRHESRFKFQWDDPEALRPFREAEGLDAVVAGAATDEERARRLLTWTRAQFEPGTPDPYPPPDAAATLARIRSGETGGFCAQHAFVLVQALQSFSVPARVVTVDAHEVTEAWLADERRWTMLDPYFELQVHGEDGRSLATHEIRDGLNGGRALRVSPTARLAEPLSDYLTRYRRIEVWTRNAFTSAPVNFRDFSRYRVRWVRGGEIRGASSGDLATALEEDLWSPP